jgi:membrane protease YdiL (CAAX protease family)
MRAGGSPVALRRWLTAEYLLIFFVLVGGYILGDVPGGPLPPLMLAAVAVVVHLRRRDDFDRRDLIRAGAVRKALPGMLAAWVAGSALMVAGVALVDPARLLDLPRQQPQLWVAIVVFYPLVSVYPQELLFRAFLLHRYAPVFGTGRAAAVASTVAFGFAHLLFGNIVAVLMTLVGGWLFARRYQRTASLLTVSIEHALYGITIFTVGLGDLFYHGVEG